MRSFILNRGSLPRRPAALPARSGSRLAVVHLLTVIAILVAMLGAVA